MTNRTLSMTDNLYDYMLAHTLHEAPVLTDLREATKAFAEVSQMQIAPEQGQFMQLLLKLMGAKHVLELGTFTGYSALAMALALPQDGHIISLDINTEWTTVAKKHWELAGVSHKITCQIGPALDSLKALIADDKNNFFDYIFIDADKANYPAYYQMAVELARPGGLIAIDNTLWDGKIADTTNQARSTVSIRQTISLVHQDPRVTSSLVPIADGLLLAYKN